MYPGDAHVKWLFLQEKATFQNEGDGYIGSETALVTVGIVPAFEGGKAR
jgi:hypothetical protein